MTRLLLLLLVASAPANAAKLAIFNPAAGEDMKPKLAASVADAAAAVASRAGHDVVTQQQLESLMGLEAAKQMAGCDAGACAADLANALGVDAVLNVNVGRVGKFLVLTVKRTDVASGLGKVVDHRVNAGKGAIDKLIEALPKLITEALTGLATAAAPTTTTTTPAAALPIGALPVLRQEKQAVAPTDLVYVDDGAGRVIAFSKADPMHAPLFAGSSTTLYAQRTEGSSRNGEDFSRSFWDPRHRDGWQRSFQRKDGAYTLQCGDKAIVFQEMKKKPQPKTLEAPFIRKVVLAGRDDQLRYVVVDDHRETGKDLRAYLGKKGKLTALAAEVEADASYGSGVIAVGEGVTIKLGPEGGEIVEGGKTSKLTAIDLWSGAGLVYGELKPWGEVALSTPCDP